MAQLDKIRLSGITYDLVDSTAVHSLEGYATTDYVTASTAALAESIEEQHYQTSGDVQSAISGKADTTAVTENINAAVSGKVDTTAYTAYTAATETALGNKADKSEIPAVSGYADSVKYNSTSKYVEFYHGGTGGTEVFSFDASPFIIDGMVDNVEIKDIPIEETLSFDIEGNAPTSALTKNFIIEVADSYWGGGADMWFIKTTSTYPYPQTILSYNPNDESFSCTTEYGFSVSATSNGNTISATVNNYVDLFGVERQSAFTEVKAVYGSQTCLVISFNTDAGKQDINIPISEIFDASNYYTTAQTDSIVSGLTARMAEDEEVTAAALNDLNEEVSGKADTSAVTESINAAVSGKVDTSAYTAYTAATATALSNKQDTLVSGTNIKTVGGNSLLGSGNIDWPAGMTASVSGTTLIFG